MSSHLARSGIDPDHALGPRSRAAVIVGIATIVLAVWQAFSGARGPVNAILAVVGFFSQLAVIGVGGFCALFALALAVVWAGRRLSIW